jgi:hypothetical protein
MRNAWLLVLVGVGCGGEGKCLDATCMNPRIDGSVVLVDAPSFDMPNFVCADDSALEPNNSIGQAFVTPVDTQAQMVNLAGLALCPAGDKDHYRVTLSAANKSLEVIAMPTNGPNIQLSILNAGGTSIANGVMTGVGLRACTPNLPVGTYFASVTSASENNYSLSIKVLNTCN